MTEDQGNTKMLTLRLPADLHRELKIAAARGGATMQDIVIRSLKATVLGEPEGGG